MKALSPILISVVIFTWVSAALSGATSIAVAAAPSSDWVKTDETSDGITAYRREIPGSDLIAFRGEGDVDSPLPLVATILTDASQGTDWVEDLKESKILHWIGPDEFIEYDHFGMPLVISDRDFVSHAKITIDSKARQFRLEFTPAQDPSAPSTRHVIGELIHGNFVLSPLPGGKTHVDADIHVDPKGSIPKWLVNFFQKDWPVSTFRGLRKQAAKKGAVNPRFAKLFS